jgi:hypothetical protein
MAACNSKNHQNFVFEKFGFDQPVERPFNEGIRVEIDS